MKDILSVVFLQELLRRNTNSLRLPRQPSDSSPTLAEPRIAATESRLGVVMQQLIKLAKETDANPESRAASLLAERDRLDQEIQKVRTGRVESLADAQALERIREIISLADGLAGDFRRVRDDFERLNRELRERLMDEETGRGEVLERLFQGVDVIAESEAGRTFSAFWRLLTDPEQSATLDDALDQVLGRQFASQLQFKERRFLLGLTRTLLAQGGIVHDVLQQFAGSLRSFVQSREYLEQRRINHLLRQAQRAALALKEDIRATEALEYTLPLTSSRLSSLSQWTLIRSLAGGTAGRDARCGRPVHCAGISGRAGGAVGDRFSRPEGAHSRSSQRACAGINRGCYGSLPGIAGTRQRRRVSGARQSPWSAGGRPRGRGMARWRLQPPEGKNSGYLFLERTGS